MALAVAGTPAVQAQTNRLHIGPRVSYQFDLEEAGLGAQFSAPIAQNLEFYPSFDIFLVDHGSAQDINADLKYRLPTATANWLYVGAGLNLARRSPGEGSNTNAGLNAFVGAESLRGSVHPFGEFRFTANNGSTGQLSVGVNFTL
jgi:hypothetical protein